MRFDGLKIEGGSQENFRGGGQRVRGRSVFDWIGEFQTPLPGIAPEFSHKFN